MNRIKHQLPLHLLRPALAALAFAVIVATVTAAFLTPASAATVAAATTTGSSCAPNVLSARSGSKATTAKAAKAKQRRGKKAASKHLSGKLNINTATSEQLRMLPGVGPSKADRVVAYRKANGAFKRVKDLRRVKGFGYKSLKKLDRYLAVSGATTLQVASAPTAAK